MSTNLHLIAKRRGSCRQRAFALRQTPTEVTWAAKPELNNREFTASVYAEWVRSDYPHLDKYQREQDELHIKQLYDFLSENPHARFEAH